MITFTTIVEVTGKSPDQVYDWVLNLNNDKYRRWHPAHKEWKTIKRTHNEMGSIVYLDEQFNHFRLKLTGKLVEVKPNRFLLYKWKSLISGYLSLTFESTNTGTKVTHEVGIGYKGLLGKIIDWLLRKFYLTKAFEEALEKHAKEEFRNLEEII